MAGSMSAFRGAISGPVDHFMSANAPEQSTQSGHLDRDAPIMCRLRSRQLNEAFVSSCLVSGGTTSR
jgi:hypothetical protein